jgi:IS30 family transposase
VGALMANLDPKRSIPHEERTHKPKHGEHLLTPERHKKLVQLLEDGMYIEPSAWLLGVAPRTVHNWLHRGRDEKDPSDKFFQLYWDCQRAQAWAERDALMVVRTARHGPTEKDWRAAMEFLARRHRQRWSPTQKVETEHLVKVKRVILEDGEEEGGL